MLESTGKVSGDLSLYEATGSEDGWANEIKILGASRANIKRDFYGRTREFTDPRNKQIKIDFSDNGLGVVTKLTADNVTLNEGQDSYNRNSETVLGTKYSYIFGGVNGDVATWTITKTLGTTSGTGTGGGDGDGGSGDGGGVTKTDVTATAKVNVFNGQLVSFTDFNGSAYSYQYDGNRLSGDQILDGETYTYTWSNPFELKVSHGNNPDAISKYDVAGRLLEQSYGNRFTKIKRNAEGKVVEVRNNLGVTSYTYTNGDLTKTEFSPNQLASGKVAGEKITVNYSNHNALGIPGTVEVPRHGTLTRTFHENGSVKGELWTSDSGEGYAKAYDELGALVGFGREGDFQGSAFTPNKWGRPQDVGYSELADLQAIAQGTSSKTTESYSLLGARNDLQWTLANGTSPAYDSDGRLTGLTIPGLADQSFSYDDSGRLIEITQDTNKVSLEYGDGSVLSGMSIQHPDRLETRTFTYDDQNRVTQVTADEAQLAAFSYNEKQQLDAYTDNNGVTYNYSYDGLDRINGVDIGTSGPSLDYGFDLDGNQTSLTSTNPLTGSKMGVVYSDYDNGIPGTFTWLASGAMQPKTFMVTRVSGRPYIQKIEMLNPNAEEGEDPVDADGFRLELNWSNPNAPIPLAQIDSLVRSGPGLAEKLDYTYTSDGRLASASTARDADGDGNFTHGVRIFTINYDHNGDAIGLSGDIRVEDIATADPPAEGEEQVIPAPVLKQDFRLTRTMGPSQTPRVENLSFDTVLAGSGQSKTTTAEKTAIDNPLTFDNLGNLIESANGASFIEYDGLRRIARIGGNALREYSYDLANRPTRIRQVGGVVPNIVLAYEGSRVIAVGTTPENPAMNSPLDQTKITWQYAIGYGPMGPALIHDLNPADGDDSYYIFSDHLGTPFAYQSTATGHTFYTPTEPSGRPLPNQLQTPRVDIFQDYRNVTSHTGGSGTLGYTMPTPLSGGLRLSIGGHLMDQANGIIHMHHRSYSPTLGHFLNADYRLPNPLDPTTFKEPYAYAAGNPTTYWDPTGLESAMTHRRAVEGVQLIQAITGGDAVLHEDAANIIWTSAAVDANERALLYGFTRGALKGAAITLFIVTLPVSGTTLAIIGGVAVVGGSVYGMVQRSDADQTGSQVFWGGISDGTGLSSLYAGFTNKDIATGQDLGLDYSQRGEIFGTFYGGALGAAVSAPTKQLLISKLKPGPLKDRYIQLLFKEMMDGGPNTSNINGLYRQPTTITINTNKIELTKTYNIYINSSSLKPKELVLMSSDDLFRQYASKRIITPRFFDVIAHGNSRYIRIDNLPSGKTALISHRILARLIKQHPDYNGETIRLLSCSTGGSTLGFAQGLADHLGVTVQAPNKLLWANPNGKFTISSEVITRSGLRPKRPSNGKWVFFKPNKKKSKCNRRQHYD